MVPAALGGSAVSAELAARAVPRARWAIPATLLRPWTVGQANPDYPLQEAPLARPVVFSLT